MQAAQIPEQIIDPAQHGAIREELRRILESSAFRGSRRCCRFLEYSVDHVLAGGGHEELRERNIGIEVFQRPPDYDTAEDAVVRVTANEVRKRLAQYSLEAGSNSNPVIGLAPGSYAASFRWKPTPPPLMPEVQPVQPGAGQTTRRWMLLSVPLALGLIAGLWWITTARRSAAVVPRQETSDRLWSAIFRDGKKTNIVMADAARYEIEQMLEVNISLAEYLSPDYPLNLAESISPELRRVIGFMGKRETTSFGSASAGPRLMELGVRYGAAAVFRHPRHLNVREFQTDNFILLGSRVSMPWDDLFEPSLHYTARIDRDTRSVYLENRTPSPGEPLRYNRSPSKNETFVDVALIRDASRSGTTLIFNAIDMLGVEAGVEAAINGTLTQVLAGGAGEPVHSKEVLLRVQSIGGEASKIKIEAVRN